MQSPGRQMHELCTQLFPICRSITGDGFRQSLEVLRQHVPELIRFEVPSGTQCFDWQVPPEWNINDAWIETPSGKRICKFTDSNLHVVGYSTPVDSVVSLETLQENLFSLPDKPKAIPYVTSYYKRRWGFCISDEQRQTLEPGDYRVYIDSRLEDGHLTYGELIIPGETEQEVFVSSYLCHPSLANNELSGPVVATFIAKWLLSLPRRRYTYRIVIIPETIGSITYLSRNHAAMRQNIVAGFNLTCIGDERAWSYLPSRRGNTLADRAALHVLDHKHPGFNHYSFLDRGSDERQYCSPGIDLPVCSIMRSKYHCYPEYHNSMDDLELVTPDGLEGSFDAVKTAIECIEFNHTLRNTVCCEPQLGKRGLYPSSRKGEDLERSVKNTVDVLAYADGELDNIALAETIGVPLWELKPIIERLIQEGLLEPVQNCRKAMSG